MKIESTVLLLLVLKFPAYGENETVSSTLNSNSEEVKENEVSK